jgi:hypothetical protein
MVNLCLSKVSTRLIFIYSKVHWQCCVPKSLPLYNCNLQRAILVHMFCLTVSFFLVPHVHNITTSQQVDVCLFAHVMNMVTNVPTTCLTRSYSDLTAPPRPPCPAKAAAVFTSQCSTLSLKLHSLALSIRTTNTAGDGQLGVESGASLINPAYSGLASK